MIETLNLILTKFTDETLSISISLMGVLFFVLAAYWWHYRRKFNELKHQIPAQVVKNYLDSIIQNSSALKSSLFRGGGLDVEDGVPSVFPTSDLKGTSVTLDTGSSEELSQKNAEIASLKSSLSDKDKMIGELEKKLLNVSSNASSGDVSPEVDILKNKVAELQLALKEAKSQQTAAPVASGDDELQAQLAEVAQERDELKEKLQEYEIIEEDLANLKRLQQENAQLKKSLEESGGQTPLAEAPREGESNDPDPLPVEESFDEVDTIAEAKSNEEVVIEASAGDDLGVPENNDEGQKSAEELLSEFEKMLG